jgi:polysaccharide biosynthesis transport protein
MLVTMKQKLLSLFVAPWARIGLPLIVFVAGLVLTASTVALQHSVYTASARVWIPVKFFGTQKDTDVNDSAFTVGPNAIKTACEIIHSDAVAKLAYESLQKQLGAKAPSQDSLLGGLRVKPVESTDIIDLSYSNPNPDVAVAGLQAVISAFFEENSLQIEEPLQKSKVRLESQLKLARGEYSKVKNKVKQFQDQTAFIDMAADVTSLSSQKQDLEKAVEDCRHDMSGMKSKLEYAKKQLGFGPESVVAVQKLADDEIMRGLRQSIAETEVSLIHLRSKYQDEHPKVKRLKASLEEAKKGMAARYTTITGRPEFKESFMTSGGGGSSSGSGGSAGGSGGGMSPQTKMIEDMAEASTGIASMEAKLASLSSSLAAVKSKLASVPAKQLELADIHRADELATNSLTAIERELQRIHLSESAATTSSSMQVIDQPDITGTSTPNVWISGGAASAGLALFLAFLQFLLTPKRISSGRLAAITRMRTIGFIPYVQQAKGNSPSLIASVDRIRLSLSSWFAPGDALPIIITSGGKDDGKSMVAYALSMSLADAGKNVLLVDADTKSPTIHRMASIQASPGLLQYLDEPTFESFEVMQAVRENLTVIPAGGVSDGSSCIKDPRFTRLIAESTKNFDVIIIDSPDCGENLDSLATPQFECRWLAIVRLRQSLTKSVENLATQLALLPSMESALVVNAVGQKDITKLIQSTLPAPSTTKSEQGQAVESETAAW